MGVDRRIGDIQPFAEIAQGATTVVYKGYEPHLDRFVLLKVLKPEYCTDEALAQAFEEEARIAARVQHPNVVALYAHGREERQVYLAAEYVDGMDLRRLTADRRLPIELVVYIVIETAQGLGAAHEKGVLHRDIKPSNVLVSYGGQVKLTDFGMASLVAAHGEGGQEVRGTLAYLPPEGVLGEPLTAASDLFSLGATFFELLSGRPAFRGEGIDDYLQAVLHQDPVVHLRADPTIPSVLVTICRRLLEKDPQARYPDTDALVDDLMAARAALGMTAGGAGLQRYLADPDAYRNQALPPAELNGRGGDGADAAATTSAVPAEDTPAVRPPVAPPRRRTGAALAAGLLALVLVAIVWWADAPGSLVQEATDREPAPADVPAPPPVDRELTERPLDAAEEGVTVPPGEREDPPSSAAPGEAVAAAPAGAEREAPDDSAARGTERSDGGTPADDRPPEADAVDGTAPASARPGVLRVQAEPWAVVYVDGDSVGVSGTTIELPAGRHEVRLVNTTLPGVRDHRASVTVSADRPAAIAYSFWSQVGQLRLNVNPWAEVFVNGNLRGTVPGVEQPFILAPGTHTLVLRHASGSYSQTLTIEAGEVREIDVPNLLDLIRQQQ